ncbi:hypothetical protein ACO0LC_09020 [Undibacterium sp. JH2W]|uniref:hypothetical protein n=1 Tax=Undibacterium sp. JH2W TaxID=3413037 RepID=UPI003BF3F7E6
MEDVAVILLPGILGSPLENKITHEDIWPVHSTGRTVWTGGSHTATKVKLFVDDLQRMNSVTKVLRPTKWEEAKVDLVAPIYHGFVKLPANERLDKEGKQLCFTPHVYVLNYDWSVSTILNITDIKAATLSIMKAACHDHNATKFMYVTHSMGVLAALATVLGGGLADDIDFAGIVAVAGPIPGAPEALMRMMRGFPSPSIINYEKAIATKLLANNGWKFSMLAPVLPGFADLLPWSELDRDLETEIENIINFHFNPDKPVKRGAGMWSYNERSWSEASDCRANLIKKMKSNISEARKLHLLIRNKQYDLTIFNRLFGVCLNGKDTIQSMNFVNLTGVPSLRGKRSGSLNIPDELKDTYTSAQKGDGTVTLGGQRYNCSASIKVPGGIDHADAFENKNVWPYIHTGMNWIYKHKI